MQPGSQDASEKFRGRTTDRIVDTRRWFGYRIWRNRSFEFGGVRHEFGLGLPETGFDGIYSIIFMAAVVTVLAAVAVIIYIVTMVGHV